MKRIEDVELHRRPQRATFRFYDTFVEEWNEKTAASYTLSEK
jgi:hypothetical protein